MPAPEGDNSDGASGATGDQQTKTPDPAPPPKAPPPKAPPSSGGDDAPIMTTEQLNRRLEREREKTARGLLQDLGVENVEDAKTGLADLKKRREAEMTETEKLRARAEELAPKAQRSAVLEKVVSDRATAELATLTEAQRDAVLKAAGDDPAQQLAIIDSFKPTWNAAPPAPAGGAPAPPDKKLPDPGDTTPKTPSPPAGDGGGGGAPDHLAIYRELDKRNPMEAAQYRMQHAAAISAAMKRTS